MSQQNQPQQRVEQSTLSRSQVSMGDRAARKSIISGKTSIFDGIFSLLDESLKMAQIKPGIYLFMMIFVVFQLISISLWQPFDYQFHYDTKLGYGIAWLIRITQFNDIDGPYKYLIRIIIFSIAAFTFLLYLIFQSITFRINRVYYKWSLPLVKIYCEFLSVMLLVPCGNFIGQVLVDVAKDFAPIAILFFALSIFYYIMFFYGHFCNSYLFASTIYIPGSPNASWCGRIHFLFIAGVSVFSLLGWISKLFASWIQPVLLIMKIIWSIFILIQLTDLPFVDAESNAIVGTLHYILIALDTLAFIQYFGVSLTYIFHIITFFVVFILGMGINKELVKRLINNIKDKLSEEALETQDYQEDVFELKSPVKNSNPLQLNDTRKRDLFMKYGLHKSQSKCLLFMRVGIANACPLFIDWSLIKFIAEYHNNVRILSVITQFIAFFPCESRLLNYYFNTLVVKHNLGITARFTAFQVHKVKGIRQSSASSDITEKLLELKQLSAKGVNGSRAFWESVPKDPSHLLDIYNDATKTTHLYKEAITKWPNNCRLHDDYSNYLIECSTDYVEGLRMKFKSELIERGKNFAIDYSFRSLVRAYPLYLKKGIMDFRGNFIKTKRISGSASNSASGSEKTDMSSCMGDGELDIEVEDQLGKATFNYHKLRLAFQRSLTNRRSYNNHCLKVHSFLSLIVAIILIIFLYVWYFNFFNDRADRMYRQFMLTKIRYGFDASLITISIYWAYTFKFIPPVVYGNDTYGIAMLSPKSNNFNIHMGHSWHPWPPEFGSPTTIKYNRIETDALQELGKWTKDSAENLKEFIYQMERLAYSGTDVNTVLKSMVREVVTFDYCNIMKKGLSRYQYPLKQPIKQSLSNIVTYKLLGMNNLTQIRYGNGGFTWLLDKDICESITNIWNIFQAFDDSYQTLSNSELEQTNAITAQNNIMMSAMSVSYGSIYLVILVLCVRRTFVELNGLMDIMINIDKKSREEASKPLRSNYMEDYEGINDGSHKGKISSFLLYFMVLSCITTICGIYILIIYIAEDRDNLFFELNKWMYYGMSRANLMMESFIFTLFTIFAAKNPGIAPMLNLTASREQAYGSIRKLLVYNNYLLRGKPAGADNEDYKLAPCIGINDKLDRIHFEESCPPEDKKMFEYSCSSVDSGISLFGSYIHEMIDDPKSVDIANKTTFFSAYNLMNNYLIDPTYEASNILTDYARDLISDFRILLSGICFGFIAIMCSLFTVFYLQLINIDKAFSGAFMMLRRLPPLSVVSNTALLNYLQNKKEEKTTTKMTPSKSVIMNSKDAVLFLSKCSSIEIVNKSVEVLFGYKPEQLLGQQLSTIIPEDENAKIFEQMNYMKEGDAPLTFEIDANGVTDDDQPQAVNVIILGVPEYRHNIAESFVVIMRDISQIQRQREEAEKAKKKSEQLLYQILPRDIVVRLNRGEVDISFIVPSSTIVFVDIVKFSDYAATLTPAQIMENLSMVFASFDREMSKQNLITKIKLIGDVYMAAGGLFNPDEASSAHAIQVVNFGLDVLQALEEVNTLLDSSLQVRIGVNTDGPLIAGVLGTDKPLFDIIGDPINVAARLQSTAIPGTVQISQTTYEQLSGMNFNIEARGEIMLKGKGKKMAYIVRPSESSSFFHGSQDGN